MTYTTIRCELADHILTVTLNRPDRLNAFTGQMMEELLDAFEHADKDDDVRVIIVTGEGRAFCAGADLSAGSSTFDLVREIGGSPGQGDAAAHDTVDWGNPAFRDTGGQVTLRIFDCLKPVIGAINGPAVGVGATMSLAMDIRLASTDARFGFVFSRRGIVPEACSSWFLPRIVGISKALEWSYSGRVFDAEEALAAGLVRSIHEPDRLMLEARNIAREIVENSAPVSVALIRQMYWKMLGADHPMEAHKIDSRGIAACGGKSDAIEGVTSFFEKRSPHFAGEVSKDMPSFFPWWKSRTYS